MNTEKRPVGRPRLGKVKLILCVSPEILALTDQSAQRAGVNRSVYVENLLRFYLEQTGHSGK